MTPTSRLSIHGVTKSFGARAVLRGVDLELPAGRITALVGPNGSGKTTLIKVVLGLARADAGDVRLDGTTVLGNAAERSRVGYAPQAPRFPDHASAREVITLIATLRGVAPESAVADAADAFALASFLDQPLGTCSGGQRQRVNVAVAMLGSPDVLILDEPTAGLDPVASSALKDRIHAERVAGRAVLVTSHVLSDLEELADDVVFLLEGRVQFTGTLARLKQQTGEATVERAVARLMSRRLTLVVPGSEDVA
jgi:Cu-processing system ATP-binding protein